ncbi:MAG: methyl-accepting chemotaxis protein [Bacillota bacterium]
MRSQFLNILKRVSKLTSIKRISIGLKLNISFIGIIALSLTIVVLFCFNLIQKTLIDESRRSTYELVKQTSQNIRTVLEEIDKLSMTLSRDNQLGSLTSELDIIRDEVMILRKQNEIKSILNKSLTSRTDITNAMVVSNSGSGVVSGQQTLFTYEPLRDNPTVKSYFQSKAKSKWFDTYVQDISSLRSNTDSGRVIGLAKNMYTETSLKSVGFIMFFIRENTVNDLIKSLNIPSEGEVYLIGKDNNIILNPNKMSDNGLKLNDLYKNDKNSKYIPHDIYNIMQKEKKGTSTAEINGKKMLITYETLEDIKGTPLNWTLVSVTEISKITDSVNKAAVGIIFIGALCLIIGLAVSFLITRDITKGIKSLVVVMDDVKMGNLNVTFRHDRSDEIGSLQNNFEAMILSLKDLINSIKKASAVSVNSSQTVSSSCEQNYAAIQELTSMLETVKDESRKQINNVIKSREEMVGVTEKINKANEDIKAADEIINKSKELSNNNKSSVELLYSMSNNIKSAMNEISSEIKELIDASAQIYKITKALTDISGQTNLLALNAAIEAARAGVHGKSFSLVAEEVKKLSVQSKEFASDIDNKLKNITRKIEETNTSVNALQQVVQESESSIDNVVNNFDNNVSFLNSIVDQMVNIRDSVFSIENSKKDIISIIDNISSSSETNMSFIDDMTHSTKEQSDMVKQLVKNSEDLLILAHDLEKEVNRFNV